ncbi:hypothetical protein CIPAW_11G002600 [Carya illinoinensis]|uniref:Uncharacterized protein n=1 Tax=Carya illinoinensis TaxID=32201 RepID=A0A8T1NTE3_CARIL|nr:hypothetical protein CIPAW_11G002600 [Carya illinoinensis]
MESKLGIFENLGELLECVGAARSPILDGVAGELNEPGRPALLIFQEKVLARLPAIWRREFAGVSRLILPTFLGSVLPGPNGGDAVRDGNILGAAATSAVFSIVGRAVFGSGCAEKTTHPSGRRCGVVLVAAHRE